MPAVPDRDLYRHHDRPISAQSRKGYTITPSDTVDLPTYAKALYIGGPGDVKVILVDDADDAPFVFKNHPIGYCPAQGRRVFATGTTATDIVALLA